MIATAGPPPRTPGDLRTVPGCRGRPSSPELSTRYARSALRLPRRCRSSFPVGGPSNRSGTGSAASPSEVRDLVDGQHAGGLGAQELPPTGGGLPQRCRWEPGGAGSDGSSRLWVPEMPHVMRPARYSWSSPPSRSRRWTVFVSLVVPWRSGRGGAAARDALVPHLPRPRTGLGILASRLSA